VKRLDAHALAIALRRRLGGDVQFDDGARALYATDASNYRQVPIGVVRPRTADDVVAAIDACREFGAPILARGGGTSLAGQCCNVAVVMDLSRFMNRLVAIDPAARRARVEPGLVLDELRGAAERHGLTFAPDPSTHNHCTLGGMIGNDSCGTHSLMGGKTSENVVALDVVTYDGVRLRAGPTDGDELERKRAAGGRVARIYRELVALRDRYADLIRARYPKIPRRVSGYNLNELLPENGFNVARALCGSEGTCVTVLEAELRLVPSPPARSLLVVGYRDVFEAGDHVPELLQLAPIALEGIDDRLIEDIHLKGGFRERDLALLPEGGGFLLVEFGGATKDEADDRARAAMDALARRPEAPRMRLYDDARAEAELWKLRESGLGATARIPGAPDAWEGWEDSAVHPDRLGDYLRELRALLNRYQYKCALYGHFGQGCVHTRIDFDLKTFPGVEKFRAFLDDAADLVIAFGGSISGEHGDGQSKADLLPKMFGPELMEAFRAFKAIWDPDWRMNPGKVVDPYHPTNNLRLGPSYQPKHVDTHFAFPDDRHSFAYATERCVGVGECRRHEGGTMCPSYMVTREEKHSTRGRAHLLFEMLQGDPLRRTWRSKPVREALDLCLACKGCKGECPVNVDLATYKAEFLAHYYKRRIRPIAAFTMGLIYWWARLASLFPRFVNWLTHAPLVGDVFKLMGGVHRKRDVPRFARQTFRQWFSKRPIKNEGRPRVILWPDTFNDHFLPETAIAAVEVLEDAGWQVALPPRSLCCGRPLYDYGMLTLAKRMLRQLLGALRDELELGTPVVALEPSCLAVFRDELCNLLPDDEDARRLKAQSYLLSEFLQQRAHYHPPHLPVKALVHGHCHHQALASLTDEEQMLGALGLDYRVLDSGCCGMAGAFGYERAHYDVAQACGERVLLPEVRRADRDTVIVADGFSCREQIRQSTDRRALHLAEVIQWALHKRAPPPAPEPPRPSAGWLALIPLALAGLAIVLLLLR
jgi:FAD/FMN-containing dehydrogenase/Fe-S oxidoreductase